MKLFIIAVALFLPCLAEAQICGAMAFNPFTRRLDCMGSSANTFANALDYGADPTNTNDSTTALNNLINSMGVIGSADYQGFVIVPPGTYKCSGTLSWGTTTKGTIWLLPGAILSGCTLPTASGNLATLDWSTQNAEVFSGSLSLPNVTNFSSPQFSITDSSGPASTLISSAYTGARIATPPAQFVLQPAEGPLAGANNTAGSALNIRSGLTTGNSTTPVIAFQQSQAGSSGTQDNPFVTVWQIGSNGNIQASQSGESIGTTANPIQFLNFYGGGVYGSSDIFRFTGTPTVSGGVQNIIFPAGGGTVQYTSNSVPFSSISGATNTTAAMVVGTGASLAFTGTSTLDMSADTNTAALRVPVGAGFTASNTGVIAYDTTNSNTHIRAGGGDAIAAAFATAPTTGNIVGVTVAGGSVLLSDGGFAPSNIVRKGSSNVMVNGATLDMSALSSATVKLPVAAGATASADGAVDYDSTNTNTHIRTNGADSIAAAEASALAQNAIPKATDATHALLTASSITDNGTKISSSEFLVSGNTQRLTADTGNITATTAATGTVVFTWGALPVSTNFNFHCAGTYTQATAAGGVSIAIQGATNAPTRIDAWATLYSTNPASTTIAGTQAGTFNLTTTTATLVAAVTPSATGTQFQWNLEGEVQNGASATTLNIIFFSGNSSDAVVVKAGSYCSLTP